MTSWLNVAAVAAGGAVGAVGRYLITMVALAAPGGTTLWGTTAANLVGCGLLGGLAEYSLLDGGWHLSRWWLACRVGFLGSLTTFSTFAAESAVAAGEARWAVAVLYVAVNLLGGWALLIGSAAAVRGWLA